MTKDVRKSKMTPDKLVRITQDEFLGVRRDMNKGFSKIHEDLKHFATKDDLKHFATKDDLNDLEDKLVIKIQKGTADVLQAVDKIVTRFDRAEKEEVAHTYLHKHITDELHGHDQRIKKLETKV